MQTDKYPTVHLEDPLDPVWKFSDGLQSDWTDRVTKQSVFQNASANDSNPAYIAAAGVLGVLGAGVVGAPGVATASFVTLLNGVHGDPQTYLDVAWAFDHDTSSHWDAVRNAMNPFLGGQVVPDGFTVSDGTILSKF